MSSSHQKRQLNFVDRSVQGALARRVFFHWSMFMGTCVVSVSLMQVLLGDPNQPIASHLQTAGSRYLLFLIVFVSLLPAFVLDTIRLSNRFAGPVSRLRNAMRKVADGGSYEPLKFRGNDFWTELADDYNRFMVETERRIAAAEGRAFDAGSAEATTRLSETSAPQPVSARS